MDTLRVRAYNVGFGDAILVTLPDLDEATGITTMRHILIDVGNVLSGSGGQDHVFGPVLENIAAVLDGRPLDLYIMTHEHLDHVQGLLWAKEKLGLEINATHAWLTASAADGYYQRFPEAQKKRLAAGEEWRRIALFFQNAADEPPVAISTLLLNNNPRKTDDCVRHLRQVGLETHYVHRGFGTEGTHPFREATFEIWGPEEDTSTYYGRFRSMALGATTGEGPAHPAAPVQPRPPSGVDASAFFNLVSRRQRGIFDNLLAIDKAANDSSVVFLLEWRGWRLLFPGDAEHRSWKEMDKQGILKPAHFLKVGHHGSWNGTPPPEILEKVLPFRGHDNRPRRALVSTHEGSYYDVPSAQILEDFVRRGIEVSRIGATEDPLFVDLKFPA